MNQGAKKPITTVVLSGGAPTSPLMAGFLYAVLEKEKHFIEFHTSGAGALMALLSISPKKGDPLEALRKWVESAIADEVYAQLPVNFKLFRKPGPFAPLFQKLAERFKVPLQDPASFRKPKDIGALLAEPGTPNPMKDLLADWLATDDGGGANAMAGQDAVDRGRDRLRTLWNSERNDDVFEALRSKKDPIKRFRDNWLMSWLETDEQRRVYNDIVDLWFAAITPTTLNYRSKGLAAPLPFLDDIVDFNNLETKLKDLDPAAHLYVNAYNMTKDAQRPQKFPRPRRCSPCQQDISLEDPMEIFTAEARGEPFTSGKIDVRHIRAAFSMPFIYPPTVIDGKSYSEGADQEPINFRILRQRPEQYQNQKVVLLDALGALEDCMVRPPRDLWDAYVISIMTPVVGLANMSYEDFQGDCGPYGKNLINLERIDWKIPPEAQPFVMDWSYSNLSTLFRVGYERGIEFVDKNWP